MKKWKGFVITGAASAGKTSVIHGLQEAGYPVVEEISTAIIQEGWHPISMGRDVFQKEILRRQLHAEEQKVSESGTVFLDRGLLDGVAHYLLDNLPVPEVFAQLDLSHYAGVVVLEHLGVWAENGVRFEDLNFAKAFEPVVEFVYRDRGLPVIRVPVLPIPKRVDFILTAAARILAASS